MTVEELINDLKMANPKAKIRFALGSFKEVEILSIYSPHVKMLDGSDCYEDVNNKDKILWIDVQIKKERKTK